MLRSRLQPVVCVLVALTFARALGGGLVYDDLKLIAANPAVTGPFDAGAVLGAELWGADFPYFRPLTQLALWLGWHLGGAAGIHALALLVHLGAVAVVFSLARRLGLRPAGAALAALTFGVHPVQVESVAWCSAINDPLWGLAALLAVDAAVRDRSRGGSGVSGAVIAWCALGLLAKETAAVTPALVAAVVGARRWTGADPLPARARAYWPLAAVVLGWLALRALVFGDLRAGFDRSPVDLEVGAGRLLSLRVELLARWLLALALPFWPSAFRQIERELPAAELLGYGALLLAAAAAMGWAIRRRRALPLVGAGLLFVPLLPGLLAPHVLNLYPVADRYLYLGAAGLALPWAAWAERRRPWCLLAMAVAALFAVLSARAIGTWADQARFFDVHVARHPDDPRLLYTQAAVRLERAFGDGPPADLAAAEAGFERALRLAQAPRYGGGHARARLAADIRVGLAWCAFVREGRSPRPDWRRVHDLFAAVLAEHETVAQAHVGIASCLANLGLRAEAERHLLRALAIEPGHPAALANLALLRSR